MTTDQLGPGLELDPGAYIGQKAELEAESIPGGIQPGDQRAAAYASQPGVAGEPDHASDGREEGAGPGPG